MFKLIYNLLQCIFHPPVWDVYCGSMCNPEYFILAEICRSSRGRLVLICECYSDNVIIEAENREVSGTMAIVRHLHRNLHYRWSKVAQVDLMLIDSSLDILQSLLALRPTMDNVTYRMFVINAVRDLRREMTTQSITGASYRNVADTAWCGFFKWCENNHIPILHDVLSCVTSVSQTTPIRN